MGWALLGPAIIVLLAMGCTSFPTVKLGGPAVSVGPSKFRPVVVQANHSDFFVTKSTVYAPVTRDLKVVKVVLKSADIRAGQCYDFTSVLLKVGDEWKRPRFVRFFPGDNPYGFLYGGGDKPSAVTFWGDGRFTVVLGYVTKSTETPSAVGCAGQVVALPGVPTPAPDVSDGYDEESPPAQSPS